MKTTKVEKWLIILLNIFIRDRAVVFMILKTNCLLDILPFYHLYFIVAIIIIIIIITTIITIITKKLFIYSCHVFFKTQGQHIKLTLIKDICPVKFTMIFSNNKQILAGVFDARDYRLSRFLIVGLTPSIVTLLTRMSFSDIFFYC